MNKHTHVQLADKSAQVVFALSQTNRWADYIRKLLKRQTSAKLWFFIEERNGRRVPLSRHQATGVQGPLPVNAFRIICCDICEYVDQDFGREMYLGLHLG